MFKTYLFPSLQFFPISLFSLYAFWHGTPTGDRWLIAFQIGAAAGILQLLVLLPQARPVNRLLLGCNVYLMGGGIGAAVLPILFLVASQKLLTRQVIRQAKAG